MSSLLVQYSSDGQVEEVRKLLKLGVDVHVREDRALRS
jgi:hypothetical protein